MMHLCQSVDGCVEAGVAGMRSLRLEGGQWEGAEFDIDNTGYVRIALNYRPEVP